MLQSKVPLFCSAFLLATTGCVSPKGTAPTAQSFPQFQKVDSLNPILNPSSDLTFTDPISGGVIHWESRNVLNPTAVVRGDTVYLLYRAQDATGTSRIGLATSTDGLHFEKSAKPVFYPDLDEQKVLEWNRRKEAEPVITKAEEAKTGTFLFDGVEDPRVVEAPDGTYVMTYTAYDGETARLCLATSADLRTWSKLGPVLRGADADTWSKSGAIVCERVGDKIVATKIDGKYWMYFGDTDLFMATSTDLARWSPVRDEESNAFIEVLHPRRGYFDSRLVEPGPYALSTEGGIVLIYNASNAASFSESGLPKFAYAAGYAVYDSGAPYKLIARSDAPFIEPDKDYERVGEVNEVCFVEGLVHFRDQWYLYYGTADSKIAVAVLPGRLEGAALAR